MNDSDDDEAAQNSSPKGSGKPPSVSILMLIKNERPHLEKSIDRIRNQDYAGDIEFVYVDSGSTDGTLEFMASRGINAHKIPPSEFHHGRTRNYAATLANNEILVLLTGDAIPLDDHWLPNLMQPFDDPAVEGVYGRQVAPPDVGLLRRRAMQYLYHDEHEERAVTHDEMLSMSHLRFSNANSAVRSSRWRIRPFRENGVVAEDHGMCFDILMAGKKIVYAPDAAVIHGHERNAWGEFQFAFENGFSLARMGILGHPRVGGELRYGLRRIANDLRYYLGGLHFIDAFSSTAISILKWLGVQLGKRERLIPGPLLRRISPMVYRLMRQTEIPISTKKDAG